MMSLRRGQDRPRSEVLKTSVIMTRMMSYRDMLRDPRWQRKRLTILQRDNFRCRACGDRWRELEVHHFRYPKEKPIWEVDDTDLITYCADCHSLATRLLADLRACPLDILKAAATIARRELGYDEVRDVLQPDSNGQLCAFFR